MDRIMEKLEILGKAEGESTRYWIYRLLVDNIVGLRLLPGQVLGEQELSDALEVSRTPLREALFQLSQEQFVTIIPQGKTFVSKINLEIVEEARYLRRCVEMDIMRKLDGRLEEEHLLAIKYNLGRQELAQKKGHSELMFQLDEELHKLFFEIVGMSKMWDSLTKRNLHLKRLRNLYHSHYQDTAHVLAQHRALVKALERGDFRAAEKEIDKHLSNDGWDITTMKDAFPEYFA